MDEFQIVLGILTLTGVLANITKDFWMTKLGFVRGRKEKKQKYIEDNYLPRIFEQLNIMNNMMIRGLNYKSLSIAKMEQEFQQLIILDKELDSKLNQEETSEQYQKSIGLKNRLTDLAGQLGKYTDWVLEYVEFEGQVDYLSSMFWGGSSLTKEYRLFYYALDGFLKENDEWPDEYFEVYGIEVDIREDHFFGVFSRLIIMLEKTYFRAHNFDIEAYEKSEDERIPIFDYVLEFVTWKKIRVILFFVAGLFIATDFLNIQWNELWDWIRGYPYISIIIIFVLLITYLVDLYNWIKTKREEKTS